MTQAELITAGLCAGILERRLTLRVHTSAYHRTEVIGADGLRTADHDATSMMLRVYGEAGDTLFPVPNDLFNVLLGVADRVGQLEVVG